MAETLASEVGGDQTVVETLAQETLVELIACLRHLEGIKERRKEMRETLKEEEEETKDRMLAAVSRYEKGQLELGLKLEE